MKEDWPPASPQQMALRMLEGLDARERGEMMVELERRSRETTLHPSVREYWKAVCDAALLAHL